MKLNNKGWGTLEMFLLSGGLLIALIVVVFLISKVYGSYENSIKNKYYLDLEAKLGIAAREYAVFNKLDFSDGYVINYETLKNSGFIGNLVDKKNNICGGYVKVIKLNLTNQYKGYISCREYQTPNY